MLNSINHILKEKYGGKFKPSLLFDLYRLIIGEPLAYIIGNVPFINTKIDLSTRPLIPRAETEFWVDKAIAILLKDKRNVLNCLDMFAGSGCIGLSILKSIKNSKVTFVEIEERLIKQIRRNIKLNSLDISRAVILESDIFENVNGNFDYVFANPPYIAKRSKKIQPSVRNWEPSGALFSDDEGLAAIKRFLSALPEHISENGKVFMEFDNNQKNRINTYLVELGFSNYEFIRDQYGLWRTLCIYF